MGFLQELGAKTMVGGLMQICANVSLLTEMCVPPTTAMTGEVRRNGNLPFPTHARSDMDDVCLQITLRGRVSVAGWRDQRKGVGCAPCGRQQVILPRANRKGVEHDVSKEVHVRTRFVIAKAAREVLDAAFGLASCCDLRMRNRLSRAGFRRTGESKRNETKEWR
jgi:ATP-dependent Lon protease